MLHRVDSMTARLRHSKQVVTKVMRWGVEFGLVVEQKPLPANKTRLLQWRVFQLSPSPRWKQGNMAWDFVMSQC